jgi:hypothetical protein
MTSNLNPKGPKTMMTKPLPRFSADYPNADEIIATANELCDWTDEFLDGDHGLTDSDWFDLMVELEWLEDALDHGAVTVVLQCFRDLVGKLTKVLYGASREPAR